MVVSQNPAGSETKADGNGKMVEVGALIENASVLIGIITCGMQIANRPVSR
jgi:hypothetical protein